LHGLSSYRLSYLLSQKALADSPSSFHHLGKPSPFEVRRTHPLLKSEEQWQLLPPKLQPNQRLQRPIQATNSELRYPQPRARTAGILLKPQRRIHQLRNHSSQTQPERAAAAAEGRLKAGTGSAGTRRGHGHPGRPPALLPRGLNYSAARQLYSGAWAGAVPRHFLVGIGRANCLRAQRRVAGTVSSGWGWLIARRGERVLISLRSRRAARMAASFIKF